MKQQVTTGIMLSRTNYGEADRILTVLTPDKGKIRLLAKGVRKIKSRMAGGIELFSVNDITYIEGRSELGTLISSRLQTNYGNIIKDVNRTMYAYEVLKLLNKVTEDSPESEYFDILQNCLTALNIADVGTEYVQLWLTVRLLDFSGHSPNLLTDTEGKALAEAGLYNFSFEDMTFAEHPSGRFSGKHLKLLRLVQRTTPMQLAKVEGVQDLLKPLVQLTKTMLAQNVRV